MILKILLSIHAHNAVFLINMVYISLQSQHLSYVISQILKSQKPAPRMIKSSVMPAY